MRRSLPEITGLAVVLAAIALSTFVRLRLAETPLERDEGEYAYAGQLVRRGTPPYAEARNMKFPGTYYAYAAVMTAFGESPRGIRTGLALVNAATALLVFALGRRLLGTLGGTVAGTAFVLLSLDRWVLGVFGHATHYVMLPVVGGLLLLVPREDPPRRSACLLGGALLGVGVLMKQHAVFFLPLGVAVAVWPALRASPRDLRAAAGRAALVAAGAAVPIAAVFSLLAIQGVWEPFRFWTFTYAKEYVSQVPVTEAWPVLREAFGEVRRATNPLWICAAGGALAVFVLPAAPRTRLVLPTFLAASGLAMLPGFYFRPHYFIVLLPAVALLVGAAAEALVRLVGAVVPRRSALAVAAAGFAVLAGSYVHGERSYLFAMSPRDLSRDRYFFNPFIEMGEIAKYIRERTEPASRIAVLGSEPELYFLADRRSATTFMYTFPLMEAQPHAARMREEMIAEIEAARPAYVVYVPFSLGVADASDDAFLRWADDYLRERYDLVGVAQTVSLKETRYSWDDDVVRDPPRSRRVIHVYRLKPAR